MKPLLLTLLILLLNGVTLCQLDNLWNGITPIKSTRADVEKILGKPESSSVAKHAAVYRTKDGEVFVLYSSGLCDVDSSHGWNLPELTVISISFNPDYPNPYKFSDLKIDRSKFKKSHDPGSLHLVDYTNEADGIVLTVDITDDSVRSFGYFPASRYMYLMCKNIKK